MELSEDLAAVSKFGHGSRIPWATARGQREAEAAVVAVVDYLFLSLGSRSVRAPAAPGDVPNVTATSPK